MRLSRFRIGFCKTKLDSKPFELLLHLWEMTGNDTILKIISYDSVNLELE